MSANPDFVYQPPMQPYLDIVYRDEDCVVLNKPSGLLTVPGRLPEHQDCLQNRVQRVFPFATIVHRLDMATSGLIIMALNKAAHVAISRQFEKRKTEKAYIARVWGQLACDSGSVDAPLICDWPNRPKQKIDHEIGKPALTHFQVLQRDSDTTLVKLKPITGRSHQLRVHMLSLGHPIVGDRLYSNPETLTSFPRLHLHAAELGFHQPTSNTWLNFKLTPPFN